MYFVTCDWKRLAKIKPTDEQLTAVRTRFTILVFFISQPPDNDRQQAKSRSPQKHNRLSSKIFSFPFLLSTLLRLFRRPSIRDFGI